MFGNNDKLSLVLINARNINGDILPFQLRLPLNKKCILPEELVSMDAFEYHEGLVNGGNIAFSIYIGEVTTIMKLYHEIDKNDIKVIDNIEITSVDLPICIQKISGKKVVYAILNEQDIVVESQEKLIEVIEQISDNFNTINNSVTKIRMLSKKK